MALGSKGKQPPIEPAVINFEAGLSEIAALGTDDLKARWQQIQGRPAPAALSRDILARALAYWLQEEHLGGLDLRTRKLLARISKGGEGPSARRVKVGSVIVREYQGLLHEVLVVPDGFCWQGQIFASLSTIARKITGTSWNGPRFFGLRGPEQEAGGKPPCVATPKAMDAATEAVSSAPRGSINARRASRTSGAAP